MFYPVKTEVIDERELGYGLSARTDAGEERIYSSVSFDKDFVICLSEKINKGDVSICQLDDIIEDLLD